MDDTRGDFLAWIALLGGIWLLYQAITAGITRVAHIGRSGMGMVTLHDADAVLFGGATSIAGCILLLIAVSFFWNKRRM